MQRQLNSVDGSSIDSSLSETSFSEPPSPIPNNSNRRSLSIPAFLQPFFTVEGETYIKCRDCDKLYESQSISNLRLHRINEHGDIFLSNTKKDKKSIPVEETVALSFGLGIGHYEQTNTDFKTLLTNSCETCCPKTASKLGSKQKDAFVANQEYFLFNSTKI
jgi:hypothetical protein